jgi:hypothetical protein
MTVINFPASRFVSTHPAVQAANSFSTSSVRNDNREAAQSISCNDCIMVGTTVCGECVVAVMLNGAYLSPDEAVTVGSFARLGLVPPLRHSRCARA